MFWRHLLSDVKVYDVPGVLTFVLTAACLRTILQLITNSSGSALGTSLVHVANFSSVVGRASKVPVTPSTFSPQLSAHEKRANSKEFIEVTETEFASVSESVRGRVKLADVNHVSVRIKVSE